MNILLINDYFEGGGAEAVFRYQFDLLKNNHEVDRFYAYTSFTDRKYYTLAYIYSIRRKRTFAAFLKNKHYDCIIIHNYCAALSPSILDVVAQYKKKTACKIIHYAHDFHLICPNRGYFFLQKGKICNFRQPPSIAEFIIKRLDYRGSGYSMMKKLQWIWAYQVRKKQKVFDLILAPSDFLTEHIRQGCPDLVVERMYNCCDALTKKTEHIAAFPYSVETQCIASLRVNVEKNKTMRLVYFGRIAKEKGLATFISAVRTSSVNYTLTIIGEGEEKNHLQSLVSAYNLQDKVFLCDKMDAAVLFSELNNYDVYVLPSVWYENAPLSIVEAATLDLGLFLAGHGGVMEMGRICRAAHFFDPSDPVDMVEKMKVLYTDFVNDALPKASKEKLQALFSKDVYIQNLNKYLKL